MVKSKTSKPGASGFLSQVSVASEFVDAPVSVLVYGDPGAGKTHLLASAQDPIILLTEANGRDTIRKANPDALVYVATNAEEVRNFMRAALNGEFEPAKRKTIGIDSLTEIQRLFCDEILSSKRGDDRRMELQDWGLLTERMRGFCRTVRSLPYDVIATALAEHVSEESRGAMWTKPAFQGKKLAAEVAQYFNAVGFAYKRELPPSDDDKPIDRSMLYAVDFDPGRRILSKAHDPLIGVVSGTPLSAIQTIIHS